MGWFSAPKTKIRSSLTPDQKRWMRQMGGALSPMIGQPGPVYGGQRFAEAGPLQQSAFNWAGGLPGQAQQMQNFGMGMLSAAPNFDATRQYTADLWNRDIAPGILERFAGMGGAASGGAQRGLQRAGEQMSLGLASQLAPMELQGRLGAASQLPGLYGMGLSGLNMLGGLGGEQRNITQQGLEGAQMGWREGQPIYSPVWDRLPLLFGDQTVAMQSGAGLGYSMASGMAQGLGAGMGMA